MNRGLVFLLAAALVLLALAAPDGKAQTLIDRIDSPRGESASAWNGKYIALALFEQISTDVEISIVDRKSGKITKSILPNSYIVYSMFFDRNDQNVLWAMTSQRAAVFRIDVIDGSFQEIASLGDQRYIFAGAQHPNGEIFVGTFPDAKVYRIKSSEQTEISQTDDLIGNRTNIKDIFIPQNGIVYLHVGSPGTLIAFDPETKKVASIVNSADSFLFPARDVIGPIESIRSVADFKNSFFESAAPNVIPDWAKQLFPLSEFQLRPDGFELTITHDGRETTLSTAPRSGGMPITAFDQVTATLAVGSTYWNRWFFKFDLATNTATPLGPIGRTGEFFTACSFAENVVIPHYLGLLLAWRPDLPLQAPAKVPLSAPPDTIANDRGDNPRELLMRPDGHVGLDCLDVGNRHLIYSTAPNYSQEAGQILRVAIGDSVTTVTARGRPTQTISRLALTGGKLYAGTSEARGLGLQKLVQPPRPRVVELDLETLAEIRSVEIPLDRHRNTTALVAVSEKRLLLGTEGGGLFLINDHGDRLSAEAIGPRCSGVSSAIALSRDIAAALCGGQLFIVDGISGGIADAASLPGDASYLAKAVDGGIVVTANSGFLKVSSVAIEESTRRAKETISSTTPIGDGEFDVYKLRGVLLKDSSAWISPRPANDAIGKSFVGLDLGGKAEDVVGATVVWVWPPNTPRVARFEYSDDGTTWVEAASVKTSPAPSSAPHWSDSFSWPSAGVHRYWRVTPAEGLREQFAVEFLELKRRVE